MEFVKNKVEVKIYGESYSLTKPTVKMVEELGQLSEGKTDMEKYVATKNLVVSLGLPMSVVDGMEIEPFNALVEHLMPKSASKKN